MPKFHAQNLSRKYERMLTKNKEWHKDKHGGHSITEIKDGYKNQIQLDGCSRKTFLILFYIIFLFFNKASCTQKGCHINRAIQV